MIWREMSAFANIDAGREYFPSHLASNLIELNFTPLPLKAQAKNTDSSEGSSVKAPCLHTFGTNKETLQGV